MLEKNTLANKESINYLLSLFLHACLLTLGSQHIPVTKEEPIALSFIDSSVKEKPVPNKQVNKQGPAIKQDIFALTKPLAPKNKGSYNEHKAPSQPSSEYESTNVLQDDKFVYSSFFDRVRAQLDSIWQSEARTKVSEYYKKHKRVMKKQLTVVIVTLSPEGELLDIHFTHESGNTDIDRLALQAFREAKRFVHPPKDLIRDGKIVFDWHFIIDLQ